MIYVESLKKITFFSVSNIFKQDDIKGDYNQSELVCIAQSRQRHDVTLNNFLLHAPNCGKAKHELWVTSYEFKSTSNKFKSTRVTSTNSWVTSSNPRVTSSNPRVRRLKARVARLKAQVRRLKARVEAIKPRVKE